MRKVCGHMLINLLLGRSSGGFLVPSSDFGVSSLADTALLDHLNFRFAIMAQAIFPCHLLLRGRVKVIGQLVSSLLPLTSCGPYGRLYACQ